MSIAIRPSAPSQTCVVSSGQGTIDGAPITDVVVACTTDTFSVGGSVSGLEGSGLVLRLNDGDDLSVLADGPFAF